MWAAIRFKTRHFYHLACYRSLPHFARSALITIHKIWISKVTNLPIPQLPFALPPLFSREIFSPLFLRFRSHDLACCLASRRACARGSGGVVRIRLSLPGCRSDWSSPVTVTKNEMQPLISFEQQQHLNMGCPVLLNGFLLSRCPIRGTGSSNNTTHIRHLELYPVSSSNPGII